MLRFLGSILAAALLAGAQTPDQPLQDRPELAWWRDSIRSREQRLRWWREARFGMFIHWGVYSLNGGVWEGQPVTGYAEHIQRIRKIPIAVYREQVAGRFNPVAFDADAWVRAAKRAGMGYLIITAKHHDGFAMYDSAVGDYNIMKATPWGKTGRDPMRELKTACAKHGLRFGFYYSHAFDWGEADGAGNDWDYENPGGDRLLHGANWWEQAPALLPRVRKYVDEKAIPQVRELLTKYDPDILWFDTPHKLPIEENLRILRAARETKPDVVINGRAVQAIPGGPVSRFGDYTSTADRPAEFLNHEGDWEAIPTTNESYGYHQTDLSHKPPEHFVRLLANAAARGGNLLLNVGPRGDGAIDPKDLAILDGIGRWMVNHAESIRGTERTPLPIQAWGHSTRKGRRLYLHVFDWPSDGRLYVAGLRSSVSGARLLGGSKAGSLPVKRVNPDDVEISIPLQRPDPWDSVIVLDSIETIDANPARHIDSTHPTTLHVFHGRLFGPDIRYGDGKRLRDSTLGWRNTASGVSWNVRVTKRGTYSVSADYATSGDTQRNSFRVFFGDTVVEGPVLATERENAFRTRRIGQITLEPGEFTISVRPASIAGSELMRLRVIELTPMAPPTKVGYADLPDPVRRELKSRGVDASSFDSFVRGVDRRTRERSQAGRREALVYYVLQSARFTLLPRIEPAQSAKQFVESGASSVPDDALRRWNAFLTSADAEADERYQYFRGIARHQPDAPAFFRRCYAEAMRFLYEKEFATPKERVPLLYQQRANSTDTALEASFPVDLALRVIGELSPGVKLTQALVVGPGLDLAPRTGLSDDIPPQSTQPFAVADSLIANGLADRAALRIHCVDVEETVVRHLAQITHRDMATLLVRSGLGTHASGGLTEEYRRYLAEFGRAIGKRTEDVATVDRLVTRAITAERLNIVTERYPARSYDLVVATNVFPYLSDPELALALANIAAMLRPGGYLIHNDLRPTLPELGRATGLGVVQVRGVVLASGRGGSITDTAWIHRYLSPHSR